LIGYMDKGHSRFCGFVLAVICCAAFMIRSWGIEWPSLHPDEHKIASWMEFTKDHSHIEDRFYASGFFVLIKPAYAVNRWMVEQANRRESFLRVGEKRPVVERPAMLFARWFNVCLAVINVAVLYFLIAAITRSGLAGLLGAFWLALSPLHVEHSHYAETDIAAMLMLTLSLWLWTRVLMKGGAFRFGLAAVVTGFAIGTKFTLLPLLVCALIMAWRPLGVGEKPSFRDVFRRSCSVILLCLAGLIAANPGLLDWNWFLPQMQRALNSVYGERAGLMGDVVDKWMPVLVNWKQFRLDIVLLGLPWVGLIVIGLITSFRKPCCILWPVTFVFPVVFLVYFVFLAPWVRSQEFMLFSSSFAVWGGMGIVGLSSLIKGKLLRIGLVSLLGLLVSADVAIKGLKSASIFAWPDPRVVAKEWLKIHMPNDCIMGFGPYTDPAFRQKTGRMVSMENVERLSGPDIRNMNLSYIVRNPAIHGRGTINPLTDVRFPQYDPNWDEFVRGFQRIWLWTTLEQPKFLFGCAPIECWGVRHGFPVISENILFFQPGCMTKSMDGSMWSMGGSLGSVKMVEVTRHARDLVVGGPAAPDRPVYILLQTLERGAVVRVKGLGQSHRIELPPYTVEVVILKRSWYLPRCSAYDVVNVCAEPEKYILGIPCFAEILTDESAVMCRLLQKGYPDKVQAFLASENQKNISDRMLWPAFTAATEEGNWALAGGLYQRAERLLGRLREASTNSSERMEFCGINGVSYDDYGRVRMEAVAINLVPDKPGSPERTHIVRDVILPVRVARGNYLLSFSVQMAVAEALNTGNVSVAVSVEGGESREVLLDAESRRQVSLSLRVEKETDLRLTFTAPCAGSIAMQDIELRWSLHDMIRSVDVELCRALSRYDLHSLPAAEAFARISERSRIYRDDLELSRLKLKAMTLDDKCGAGERETETSKIRATAPAYAPDIVLSGAMPVNQVFYPYFRLYGIKYDGSTKTLKCRFEIMRDEAPTPVVVLSKRRALSARWRKIGNSVLCDRPRLFKGEQYEVNIPLPDGAVPPFDDFAVSVRSNVPWVPYDFAVTGQKDSRVLLRQWFQRP